jgi:glycosyltransferase EpsD
LLLAGNGPEKKALETEISNCELNENVMMLGYCTNLEKYQRITDVFVACSHREGLPLNLVEAMLTGNPVVASINRGHRELIKDGENGYLVNDVKTMTDKVIELLKDNNKAVQLGINARKFAKDYGSRNVKQELERLYFEI